MAEPGRVQSRLSTVLIYLSKSCYNTTTTATRQQQQRLHTSRMRSFSFQLGLCDVLCKFQHHLASTRHTDTDDTLTPPLHYLAIYFIFFLKTFIKYMATTTKKREFKTTCLFSFSSSFCFPRFLVSRSSPGDSHGKIDRESVSSFDRNHQRVRDIQSNGIV